jgi:hypothetical protein
MRQELKVVVSEDSRVPYAEVPCDCMWDLIEYLSYQRVTVNYDFKTTHFTVAFPRQSAASAQELLDQWAHCLAEYAEA